MFRQGRFCSAGLCKALLTIFASLTLASACGPSAKVDGDDGPGDDGGSADADPDSPDAAPYDPPSVLMYAHSADTLYVVDSKDLSLKTLGKFGIEENITDLAVTGQGQIFAISSGKLYQVSPTTAKATFVANVPGVLNVGMTFLPDGELLATDKDGGVRRVDPTSGNITELGTFGAQLATAGDLVSVADGTMFAISDQGPNDIYDEDNLLVTVNTGTGVATPVGQIGFNEVFGCAYANGHVYAFTKAGQLIEINPTTGQGTEVKDFGIEFWGAGVTPLVPLE
jgi:outer membrane protein assembly factor BamB